MTKKKLLYLLMILVIGAILAISIKSVTESDEVSLVGIVYEDENSNVLLPIVTVILISFFIIANVRIIYDKISAENSSMAKTRFLANVSHEIRTPLNAIIGYSNLLKTADEENVRIYTSRINHSANILLDLINDVLDISKINNNRIELDYTDFDLNYEIALLFESLEVFAQEKGIELIFENYSFDISNLKGDVLRVNQVLTNVLNNAIKFTHEGFVKLTLSCIILKNGKINIYFEVQDTGIGIEESMLDSVFTPYEQLGALNTSKYGGTGLGLSIAKKLINEMGGDISVTSELNVGTTFKFNLIFDLSSDQKVCSVDDGNKLVLTDKKILVVEDNIVNKTLIIELLKSKGIENIVAAENGQLAIDILDHDTFDFILMDIEMPKMDGLTATKIIKEKYPNRDHKIIALTANALKEQIDEYLDAGFDEYISKPININNLFAKMNK